MPLWVISSGIRRSQPEPILKSARLRLNLMPISQSDAEIVSPQQLLTGTFHQAPIVSDHPEDYVGIE